MKHFFFRLAFTHIKTIFAPTSTNQLEGSKNQKKEIDVK